MENIFQTPILFIIFNRPDTTRQVFEAIRKIRPAKLFIAGDGPRENKIGEDKLCEETRSIIKQIDWPCEIKTLFQEKNLGCKIGVSTAIDWFFQNVEEGIILEDDCLPNESFFTFCEAMLNRYREDTRIMHISGDNFQDGILRGDEVSSYYFSKYTHNWGWATWRRAWDTFHPSLEQFKKFDKDGLIKKITISKRAQKFWIRNFRQTIKNNSNWDSLWMYAMWYNEGLALLPQKNLVKNIGFGQDATHTKVEKSVIDIETFSIKNIVYTKEVFQDRIADEYTFKKIYQKSIYRRIVSKIIQILKI